MTQLDARHAALLVIDVQQAFVEMASAGNARNNPQAEANIAVLLAACRGAGVPVPLTAASVEVHRWLRSRGLDAADSAALLAYYDASVADPDYWLA